ncbi:MAG: OmpA family protein [Candidatus Manganitrophaceae bacterium]
MPTSHLVTDTITPSSSPFITVVQFPWNSNALVKTERNKVVKMIARIKEEGRDVVVRIVGYTDSLGGKAHNDRLAKKRAETVADIFGLEKIRVAEIRGDGKCCYVSEKPDLNRRVEITVLGEESR